MPKRSCRGTPAACANDLPCSGCSRQEELSACRATKENQVFGKGDAWTPAAYQRWASSARHLCALCRDARAYCRSASLILSSAAAIAVCRPVGPLPFAQLAAVRQHGRKQGRNPSPGHTHAFQSRRFQTQYQYQRRLGPFGSRPAH